MRIRAVDVSSFQQAVPDGWWKRLQDEYGVGLAIVSVVDGGARPNPWFAANIEQAIEAGLEVATYCWPPSGVSLIGGVTVHHAVSHRFEAAVELSRGYHDRLCFLALDVEAGQGVTREQVDQVKAAGIPPAIYSSRSQWPAIMGSSQAFADLPLWDASYSSRWSETSWPDREIDTWYLGYGGWQDRTGWQCRGDITVLGERCDLSIFEEAIVMGVSEARVREIAQEVAAGEVARYNEGHFRDDHQFLTPFRNAMRRIRRRGEKPVQQAITRSMVMDFRSTIADVPRPHGVDAGEDAEGSPVEDVSDGELWIEGKAPPVV